MDTRHFEQLHKVVPSQLQGRVMGNSCYRSSENKEHTKGPA